MGARSGDRAAPAPVLGSRRRRNVAAAAVPAVGLIRPGRLLSLVRAARGAGRARRPVGRRRRLPPLVERSVRRLRRRPGAGVRVRRQPRPLLDGGPAQESGSFRNPAEDASEPGQAHPLAPRLSAVRGRRRATRAPVDVDRLRVRAERRVLLRAWAPAVVLHPEHVAPATGRANGRSSRRRTASSGTSAASTRPATRSAAGCSRREVLPALDRLLGENYRVHLYGVR